MTLQLVWSNPGGGPAPDYPEHHGRPVVWGPWRAAVQVTHLPHFCEFCRYDGQPWVCTGRVSAPGRPSRRTGLPPAFVRLFAFRCPSCRDLRVFDMGRDGFEWTRVDITQPALF